MQEVIVAGVRVWPSAPSLDRGPWPYDFQWDTQAAGAPTPATVFWQIDTGDLAYDPSDPNAASFASLGVGDWITVTRAGDGMVFHSVVTNIGSPGVVGGVVPSSSMIPSPHSPGGPVTGTIDLLQPDPTVVQEIALQSNFWQGSSGLFEIEAWDEGFWIVHGQPYEIAVDGHDIGGTWTFGSTIQANTLKWEIRGTNDQGTDQAATWSGVGFGAKLTFTPA